MSQKERNMRLNLWRRKLADEIGHNANGSFHTKPPSGFHVTYSDLVEKNFTGCHAPN